MRVSKGVLMKKSIKKEKTAQRERVEKVGAVNGVQELHYGCDYSSV